MSDKTSIEWTDATWNPVRGCTKISPGCKYCYAERFSERWRGVEGHPYEMGFDLRLVPNKLLDPVRWTKPRRIFVNSMSDLFHDDVPDSYIALVFDVMLAANWHIFQVLTKRPQRMRDFVRCRYEALSRCDHIWVGVSVEDKMYGLPRVEILRDTPARVRFLSIEPLLEDIGEINLTNIDWVIVGGESGPGSRPMESRWVMNIRDQCVRSNTPFFFKQWGGVRKHRHGRMLNGKTHDDSPRVFDSKCRSPEVPKERQAVIVNDLVPLIDEWLGFERGEVPSVLAAARS